VKPLVNRIIRQNPRFLYVIDQSFADYTLRPMLQPREMVDCYNMMLIGSLSKKYCIPGLRLGYIFSSPIIIDRLRQIRQPWTVNAMAIEAGKYLVSNNPQMIPDLKGYLAEAQRLRSELAAIEGIKVLKTDTNFMLAFIDFADALELKHWLIENHGILIRDASDFRGLDSHYFRIVARTEKDDNQLVAAIREFKRWKENNS
jgi:threonine-phosphate decarboxylase